MTPNQPKTTTPQASEYSKWKPVPEKSASDNFATSIYAEGWKGLLIARCDQNGERPWIAELIANAPRFAAEHETLRQKLAAADHHMQACRSLLGVADDETLYVAIEILRAENAKLKAALRPFAEAADGIPNIETLHEDTYSDKEFSVGELRAAKAAIGGTQI